ncbi:MAG: hypothetical protein OEW11_03835 [Nitrospirota bacterium]|nr:hypothetical protein [Nitrospirota bacterium]
MTSSGLEPASPATTTDPRTLMEVARLLAEDGVHDQDPAGERHFRIGVPHPLSGPEIVFLEKLGDLLLAFYTALNNLYRQSAQGRAPEFICRWLDQGKPQEVVRMGRMNRMRTELPRILRPDLFATEDGWKITELDSVPGGIGLTDALQQRYAAAGFDVVGGADGMRNGMAHMLVEAATKADPTVAVTVSEESAAYRPEMHHLTRRLRQLGVNARLVEPRDIQFREDGLWLAAEAGAGVEANSREENFRIDVLYRFFELFDLPNIPKAELLLYAARKGTVTMTPPPRAHLEEKLAMALFHHPVLAPLWRTELGEERQRALVALLPRTWVLDPTPLPAHAVIPDLTLDGTPLQSWSTLNRLGQKARQFVIKPSGFSERAWGARGVVIGHDVPESEWASALEQALAAFPASPHVLQPFHKALSVPTGFLAGHTPETALLRTARMRARLCPYYFVTDGRARLGGVLATLCPADKKRIHGMTDSVMVPCAPA